MRKRLATYDAVNAARAGLILPISQKTWRVGLHLLGRRGG
jgi:hypothetical protein